ncbi:MAG: DUF3565 domain-containing protein [Acidimicrobiales bacterium]
MLRPITGYHRDEAGDWVAELGCGHGQHVRHKPPFQLREWVLAAEGRQSRLGTPLDCPRCDRAELPETVRRVGASSVWDETTMPATLRRAHRLSVGTWGRIVVHGGRLRYSVATVPAVDVELDAGSTQAIPPEVEHHIEPLGAVRVSIELFAADRDRQGAGSSDTAPAEEGGDPACWAGLLCPECGAVTDGGYHRPGCPAGRSMS